MGVKQLSRVGSILSLQPTSIHGEGDKISLPPSVLEYLTNSGADTSTGSPWIFRIAIPKRDYTFPASPILANLQVPDDTSDAFDGEDDDDNDDDDETKPKEAYLEELRHRYHSYTHASVVEFTQDEEHIGLPQSIAKALLRPNQTKPGTISVTRSVDPAAKHQQEEGDMQVGEEDDEKTPGHLAWGAFDIPAEQVQVSLVKIPKGTHCKLIPTREALENGFYNLKDIKLVLEQSLIRTRATLSVGDIVHTWHRGVKYDLTVVTVSPATYHSISCINTDIEVDFGSLEEERKPTQGDAMTTATSPAAKPLQAPASTGYTLGSASTTPSMTKPVATSPLPAVSLREEPPETQKLDVCTVQIRSNDGGQGRRRFDIQQAKLEDLFAFASTIVKDNSAPFQLVTRFPRRVFRLENSTPTATLKTAGLSAGQELLLVETQHN